MTEADQEVEQMFNKFDAEWYEPDAKLALAVNRAMMPPEGYDLLDQRTKDKLSEVLDGKRTQQPTGQQIQPQDQGGAEPSQRQLVGTENSLRQG